MFFMELLLIKGEYIYFTDQAVENNTIIESLVKNLVAMLIVYQSSSSNSLSIYTSSRTLYFWTRLILPVVQLQAKQILNLRYEISEF